MQADRWTEGIPGGRRGFTKSAKVGILLSESGESREGQVGAGASCWLVGREKPAGLVRREADILETSVSPALGLLNRNDFAHRPLLCLSLDRAPPPVSSCPSISLGSSCLGVTIC